MLCGWILANCSRITSIIKGRQGITAATALRFGKYFGTPPEFWLNLQHLHDLANAREELADALNDVPRNPPSGVSTKAHAGFSGDLTKAWIDSKAGEPETGLLTDSPTMNMNRECHAKPRQKMALSERK